MLCNPGICTHLKHISLLLNWALLSAQAQKRRSQCLSCWLVWALGVCLPGKTASA